MHQPLFLFQLKSICSGETQQVLLSNNLSRNIGDNSLIQLVVLPWVLGAIYKTRTQLHKLTMGVYTSLDTV